MRRSTLLFFCLSLVIGFFLFQVKYAVVEVEQKLVKIVSKINKEKDNLHVLKAEWSHLNEPQRLQKLAEKYLEVIPSKADQIATLDVGLDEGSEINQALPQVRHAAFESMR